MSTICSEMTLDIMGNEQTDDISVFNLLLGVGAHLDIGVNDVLHDSGFPSWCIAKNIPQWTWLILTKKIKKGCFGELGKDAANHTVLYIDQSLQLIVSSLQHQGVNTVLNWEIILVEVQKKMMSEGAAYLSQQGGKWREQNRVWREFVNGIVQNTKTNGWCLQELTQHQFHHCLSINNMHAW